MSTAVVGSAMAATQSAVMTGAGTAALTVTGAIVVLWAAKL